jgi:hypothetical protein
MRKKTFETRGHLCSCMDHDSACCSWSAAEHRTINGATIRHANPESAT